MRLSSFILPISSPKPLTLNPKPLLGNKIPPGYAESETAETFQAGLGCAQDFVGSWLVEVLLVLSREYVDHIPLCSIRNQSEVGSCYESLWWGPD